MLLSTQRVCAWRSRCFIKVYFMNESMAFHSSNSQRIYTALDIPGANIKLANLHLLHQADFNKFFPSFQCLFQNMSIIVFFGEKDERREENRKQARWECNLERERSVPFLGNSFIEFLSCFRCSADLPTIHCVNFNWENVNKMLRKLYLFR